MDKSINTKTLAGIAVFCVGAMAANMTMGLLALIMQTYSDVSPTTIQSVLVGPALIGMIFAFFVGQLNKKISAKWLIIFCQVMLLLYAVIFFMGGNVPAMVLVVASGLAGFNQGAMNTLLAILMAGAVSDDQKRGSLLGIFISVMNIGGVVFTTLGGIVAANTGAWQNAYLLWAWLAIAIVLEIILLPNVAPEGAAAPEAPAGDVVEAAGAEEASRGGMAKVWILSFHYFFFFLALYVFGTNCSEYVITTHQLGDAAAAGVAASTVTIGGIAGSALFGAYSRVLGKFTVPVLMGLATLGLAIPVFIQNSLIGIYASGILLGFAMMGANPYIMQYFHELVSPSQYGNAMSIFSGFFNAGMVVAIYVLAFLAQMFFGDAGSVDGKFIIALVMCAVVFVTSFFIYSVGNKSKAAPADESPAA